MCSTNNTIYAGNYMVKKNQTETSIKTQAHKLNNHCNSQEITGFNVHPYSIYLYSITLKDH